MKIKNWIACIQDRGKWKEVVEKVKTFNYEVQRLEEEDISRVPYLKKWQMYYFKVRHCSNPAQRPLKTLCVVYSGALLCLTRIIHSLNDTKYYQYSCQMLFVGEKYSDKFGLESDFHVILGIFCMLQICDMGQTALLPLRRKAC